jgi:hypothetical protein
MDHADNTTAAASPFEGMPAGTAMRMLSDLLRETVTAAGGEYEPERFQQPIIGFVSTLYTDAWVTGVEYSLGLLADWMSTADPERWGPVREEVPKLLEAFKGQFDQAGWRPGLL